MREQILSQPAALRQLLGRRDEIRSILASAPFTTGPVWAAGHGDSYFAPLAAGGGFRRTSIPYTAALASEFAGYPPDGLRVGSLVIVLSMSGSVGATIAAANVARTRGAFVLAVTNRPGTPLSETAHATFFLNIAERANFLAGTVTYTASLLVLMMLALLIGEDGGGWEALQAGISALDEAVATENTAREWARAIASAPMLYMLGMDVQGATAAYGAAKMAEVADTVVLAHEMEEFFHEHHWVIRPEHPLVLLTHDDVSRERADRAMMHLHELKVPVCLVGPPPAPAWGTHLPVETVEPWVSPLAAAAPVQWLAYWRAREKGLDPDLRSHLRDTPRYLVSRKYR